MQIWFERPIVVEVKPLLCKGVDGDDVIVVAYVHPFCWLGIAAMIYK
jgi:hypothetical protein